jgi:hypothetical protein
MNLLAPVCFVILSLASATFVTAAEMPNNPVHGAAAPNSGRHFAVEFHDHPCVPCRLLAPFVRDTVPSPEFMGITLFVANFDPGKLLERRLGIIEQSPTTITQQRDKPNSSSTDTLGSGVGNVRTISASAY